MQPKEPYVKCGDNGNDKLPMVDRVSTTTITMIILFPTKILDRVAYFKISLNG